MRFVEVSTDVRLIPRHWKSLVVRRAILVKWQPFVCQLVLWSSHVFEGSLRLMRRAQNCDRIHWTWESAQDWYGQTCTAYGWTRNMIDSDFCITCELWVWKKKKTKMRTPTSHVAFICMAQYTKHKLCILCICNEKCARIRAGAIFLKILFESICIHVMTYLTWRWYDGSACCKYVLISFFGGSHQANTFSLKNHVCVRGAYPALLVVFRERIYSCSICNVMWFPL